MLDSPILGTAIGLVLIFATLALLCSGVTETISNWLQMRAKYLLTGLRSMLDGPPSATGDGAKKSSNPQLNDAVKNHDTTEAAAALVQGLSRTSAAPKPGTLTTALFNDPLIKSLQSRRVGVLKNGNRRNPQYISSKTFARALIDLLVPATVDGNGVPIATDLTKISQAIQGLPDVIPLKKQLAAFASRAAGDITKFEGSLENWYDEQMAVMAGWYKRWSRVILGVVGFVIALLLNIDTLQIGHALYVDTPAQQAVISTAAAGTLCQNAPGSAQKACAEDEINQLKVAGVPLGYTSACQPFSHAARCWSWTPTSSLHWWDILAKLAGWVITAFAVSFGAPFWFDALGKLGSLRNAGTKPASSVA